MTGRGYHKWPETGVQRCPDFLAGTREAFEEAARSSPTGIRQFYYHFAGLPVRLRAAGPELADQVSRCFRPLEVEYSGGPFALNIDIWDRTHTGVGCPGVPFAPESSDPLGGGLLTQFGKGMVVRYERTASVMALDRIRNEVFLCVQDAYKRELHERAKPFPHLLATWYQDHGVQQLHSGLVSRAGRGVLLSGGSGCGKSTCAIVCALHKFDFLGDDNVGLELTNRSCVGHAYYNSVRLDEAGLRRFPELARKSHAPIGRWDSKSMVYMSDAVPHQLAARTHIEAIVVPSIVGTGATRLAEASKGAALRSLAPSTLLVPLGPRARGLAGIAELVRRVPCYQLNIGTNVENIPDLVQQLVGRG